MTSSDIRQSGDRIFRTAGDWALASDGHQWILMRGTDRQKGPHWYPVSFVRSTKDILARCCGDKGVDVDTSRRLLEGLPDTFDEWQRIRSGAGGQNARSKLP